MIDFHSHIIYGVDDGSKDMETSIKMLKIAEKEGSSSICATSHFIPKAHEITRKNYDNRINKLRDVCKEEDIHIDIAEGLELYMSPELPKLYKEKKIWCINGKKYMLIELPMEQFPIYVEDVFYELQLLGVKPIIAHPERNLEIIKDKEKLRRIIKLGVLAQINSGSLTGMYGKEIKKTAEYFVRNNMAHLMGSDAHTCHRTGRSPKMRGAENIIKELNVELYSWMIKNQNKILQGEEVEILPVKIKKRFKFIDLFKK